MGDYTTLRYETADRVATITMARPEKRNALNVELFDELGLATERAARDAEVRAVVLAGEGKSFCAGIDLTVMGGFADVRAEFQSFVRMAQRPYLNLATMAKPTIAAVQGHALGGGFQLALACDLRLAATDAVFGMLEVRYGLVPDLGGNRPLALLVGPARAKELVWTGRTLDAEEAERIGLVNRLVEPEALAKEAEALASQLAEGPPIAISLAKTILNRAPESSLEAVMEMERQAQAACVSSEDQREAVAAYLEKRPPRFTGK